MASFLMQNYLSAAYKRLDTGYWFKKPVADLFAILNMQICVTGLGPNKGFIVANLANCV